MTDRGTDWKFSGIGKEDSWALGNTMSHAIEATTMHDGPPCSYGWNCSPVLTPNFALSQIDDIPILRDSCHITHYTAYIRGRHCIIWKWYKHIDFGLLESTGNFCPGPTLWSIVALAFIMQQLTPAFGEDVEQSFIGTNYIDSDETHYSRKWRTDAQLKSVETIRHRLISLF